MKPLNTETSKLQVSSAEARAESIVLVPCKADLETGFFLPLYTVKEMFPFLDILDPRQATGSCAELTKGPRGGNWTAEEDELVASHVSTNGPVSWAVCAETLNSCFYAGRSVRIGKQCRERWHNHLDPGLNSKSYSESGWKVEEDLRLLQLQFDWGKCWSRIAKGILGRTENSVKNRWNSLVRRGRKDLKLHNETETVVVGRLLEVMKARPTN